MLKPNKTNLFIILTFVISWTAEALFYFNFGTTTHPYYQILAGGVMWVPGVVALALQFFYKESFQVFKFNFKLNVWFLWAIAIPFILVAGTLLLSLCFPTVSISLEMEGLFERIRFIASADTIAQIQNRNAQMPVHPFILGLGGALIAGPTINAIFALGEEIGWRGYLLNELKHKSYFNASMQVGLIWGLWHAPLILMGHNFPEHPVLGVLIMVLFCVFVSPIFTYVYVKSNSILAAAIMHGTLNAAAPLSFMILNKSTDIYYGITGLAGIGTLLLLFAFVMDHDKMWAKDKVFYTDENQ